MGSVSADPPVVDLSWWQQRQAFVVLADVRWYLDGRCGQDAYDEGHLPGAVFVDLERWLAGPASPSAGRHPLPEASAFARGMGECGITDDDTVVAYDDAGGVVAARLVWMLRATGHRAAVLDGGLRAYDGPLERTRTTRPVTPFSARPWPQHLLAGIDDAVDARNLLIDAREPSRYRGDTEPVDPRAGHIPGAVNVPCRENLADDGTFLPASVLRQRFRALGVTDRKAVVSSCGSGVTACHNLLALELAGFAPGRLYPGSWSQYSNDPHRPVATGDLPR